MKGILSFSSFIVIVILFEGVMYELIWVGYVLMNINLLDNGRENWSY